MRKQVVRTAPRTIVVGQYLTAKGLRLKAEGATEARLAKYTKNRRALNPNSLPIRIGGINTKGKRKLLILNHVDTDLTKAYRLIPITKEVRAILTKQRSG